MHFDLYFPTPIWWEDTDIDTSDLLNLCYDIYKYDPTGRELSNEGGWQSKDFLPTAFETLEILNNKILEQAEQCVRDYGYIERFSKVKIENYWFNINKKGHSNSHHIHDNSFLSGAFYIKATENQGDITFYKNSLADYIITSQSFIENYTQISCGAISYKPKTGKLLLFPGHLAHGVSRNPTDEDRISIAFNVKLDRIYE